MASDRQRYALQVIFSFFLGLMVTAFIGVGVNTFYPGPDAEYQDQLDELYREQETYGFGAPGAEDLTAAEEAELDDLREEIRLVEDDRQDAFEEWARNTSIILIVFATLVMGVSLVRSEQLRIISNGLLLGGVFTMLYGTGWVIAAGSTAARFGIMTFALVVTFALGYAHFVRGRKAPPAAAAARAVDTSELERRVERLEDRLSAVASAFGETEEREEG